MKSRRFDGPVLRALLRLSLAPALALALVAPNSICHAAEGESPKREPDRIKLVAPPYFTSAPFFVAADLGYFAAEGLEVEFVNIAHSNGSLPALAQGQVDVIGTQANAAFFNLVGRGAKVRIVAARIYESVEGCAANAILARKGLLEQGRLASGESMHGLRLSVDRAGVPAFLISTLLDRLGISFDDLDVSDVAAPARVEALRRNLIDLAFVYEPDITRALESGAAEVWMSGRVIAPDFQSTFVFFGERLLEREREVGQRFVRGYLRGVERYLDDAKSPAVIEALAQRTRLDPDLLRRMCWPPTVRDGHVDAASLERWQSWAIGQGLIDAKVDVAKMVDTGFLTSAPPPGKP